MSKVICPEPGSQLTIGSTTAGEIAAHKEMSMAESETPDCVTYEEYSRMIAERDAERAARLAAEQSAREMEEKIIAHLWSDCEPHDRPADLVADLIERHDYWQNRAELGEQVAYIIRGADADVLTWERPSGGDFIPLYKGTR